MIVRQEGGLTEFIPSPQEKREGVLRDHTLRMLENLDARLKRIEEELGLPQKEAEAFSKVMARIHRDEAEARRLAGELRTVRIPRHNSYSSLNPEHWNKGASDFAKSPVIRLTACVEA